MRQTDRTILTNGRVHTPEGIMDSLTFEWGRIIQTGGQSGAVPSQGANLDNTRIIDLHGMTVLPGFCLGLADMGLVRLAASQSGESLGFDGECPDDDISVLLKAYAPKIAEMGVTEIWSDDSDVFDYDFRRMTKFFMNAASYGDLPFRLRSNLKFQDVYALNDFLSDGWRTGDGVPFYQIGAVTCGAGSEQDALIAMNAHMAGMQLCIAASGNSDSDNVLTLLEQLQNQRNTSSRHLVTRDGRWWENIMKKGVVVSAGSGRNGIKKPMSGIQSAVTEDNLEGRRMSVAEAISLYTWNSAWNGRNERRRGELAVGKDADMVVLERDPFSVNVSEIESIGVAMTICGGCVTYDAGKLKNEK